MVRSFGFALLAVLALGVGCGWEHGAEICAAGVASPCDDGNVCTADACDIAKGCIHLPNAATCSDGNACTVGDKCAAGGCVAGGMASCDDKNPCTADTCDDKTGCSHTNLANGSPCDDGITCTVAAACTSAGKCTGGVDKLGTFNPAPAGESMASDVAPVENGVVTVGYVKAAGKEKEGYLTRSNLQGDVEWTLAANDGSASTNFYLEGVAVNSSGKVAAVGTKEANGTILGDNVVLVRVDADGKNKAVTTYEFEAIDRGFSIAPANYGWLIVGHSAGKGTHGGFDGLVLRVGLDGKEIGHELMGGAQRDDLNDVIQLPDGGHLLVGVRDYTTGSPTQGWVVRLSADGKVLSDKRFGVPGVSILHGVTALPGGGALAVGYTALPTNGALTAAWLLRLSDSGDVIWSRTVGNKALDSLSDVAVLDDSTVVAVGVRGQPEERWEIMLDMEGNLLCEHQLKSTVPEYWAGVTVAAGGLVVAAGNSGKPYTATASSVLGRFDAWCNSTCAESKGCSDVAVTECHDGLPCTVDHCVGGKCDKGKNLDPEVPCEDGDACTAGERCTGGKCGDGGAKFFEATYGAGVVTGLSNDPDGGFVLAGHGAPTGSPVDGFLVKTDQTGKQLWKKPYAGAGQDVVSAMVATPAGYTLAGYTSTAAKGLYDGWIVHATPQGDKDWAFNFDYAGSTDEFHAVAALADGGYVVAGMTSQPDGQAADGWLVRVSTDGTTKTVSKTAGSGGDDQFTAVVAVPGGYFATGYTNSKGFNTQAYDGWLVSFAVDGTIQDSKVYSNAGDQKIFAMVATKDGFVFAGTTYSSVEGGTDGWLMATDAAGNFKWQAPFGGLGNDALVGLVELPDGFGLSGWVTAGSANHAWVVRTDLAGNLQWQRSYGASPDDRGHAITSDAIGLAVAGTTAGPAWLLRLDPYGNPTCTACANLTPSACNDGNSKTLDLCDPVKGCVHLH